MSVILRSTLLAMLFAVACCTSLEQPVNAADAPPPDAAILNQPGLRACNVDSDCVAVPAGCCGCNAGGSNTAINAKYQAAWRAALAKRCVDIMCPMVMSDDPSCSATPRCVNSMCVLQ